MKTKCIVVFVLLGFLNLFLLSGCHTTEGFGKDMQVGGQAVQKAAVDNR